MMDILDFEMYIKQKHEIEMHILFINIYRQKADGLD